MDIDFNYHLDKMSVIFDVGGYRGDVAAFLREKYGCGVHVFEPCRKWFSHILKRFEKDPMIWPYNVALEDRDSQGILYVTGDSPSLYKAAEAQETVRIRDIVKFAEAFKLSRIDLLKLNCEGSEYAILDRLWEKAWILKVRNIVIQFHHAEGRDRSLYESKLSVTHTVGHKCDYWQWWVLR